MRSVVYGGYSDCLVSKVQWLLIRRRADLGGTFTAIVLAAATATTAATTTTRRGPFRPFGIAVRCRVRCYRRCRHAGIDVCARLAVGQRYCCGDRGNHVGFALAHRFGFGCADGAGLDRLLRLAQLRLGGGRWTFSRRSRCAFGLALALVGCAGGGFVLVARTACLALLPRIGLIARTLWLGAIARCLLASRLGTLALGASRRRSAAGSGRFCRRRIVVAADGGKQPLQQTRLGRRWQLGAGGYLFGLVVRGCRARWRNMGNRRRRHVEVGLGQRMRFQLARRGAVVARAVAFFVELVVAQAHHVELRGFQLLIGHHHHGRMVALLDFDQRAALFIEQVVGDFRRGLHQYLAGAVLHRLLFGQSQDRQRQRFDAAHAAVAGTARTHHLSGFAQARAQALTRHFQQAETRDAADLHACTVVAQCLLQTIFDITLVFVRFHVDEIDHHQATKIAQAQLAGHFVGGFQIGVIGGFLDVATLGRACRIDVDGGQGFGLVDHDRAARRQPHLAFKRILDLGFDLVTVEQWGGILIQLELAQGLRHHLFNELARFLVHLFGVDQYFADIRAQVIAQRTNDQARFLIDQERGGFGQRGIGDRTPHLQQVIEIPLQLFGIAADAGGADDDAHVGRDVELIHRRFQRLAIIAFDAPRYPASGGAVGHQHHVAAGQRDECGQRRALVAAFFLVDLHHHFLTFAQQFADRCLVGIDALRKIIGRNFFQRQKAVLVTAVFNKRSFQRWLKASDAALVDVGLFLFPGRLFDVDVVQALAIDNGYAQLFLLSCVDQHPLHFSDSSRAHTARNAGAPHPSFGQSAGIAGLTCENPALQKPPGKPAGALVHVTGWAIARRRPCRKPQNHGIRAINPCGRTRMLVPDIRWPPQIAEASGLRHASGPFSPAPATLPAAQRNQDVISPLKCSRLDCHGGNFDKRGG